MDPTWRFKYDKSKKRQSFSQHSVSLHSHGTAPPPTRTRLHATPSTLPPLTRPQRRSPSPPGTLAHARSLARSHFQIMSHGQKQMDFWPPATTEGRMRVEVPEGVAALLGAHGDARRLWLPWIGLNGSRFELILQPSFTEKESRLTRKQGADTL